MQSLVSWILCGSDSGNDLLPPYVSALYTWSKGLPLLHRAFMHTIENGGMCLLSALVKHRIWLLLTKHTVVAYVAGGCWCYERLWTSLLSCTLLLQRRRYRRMQEAHTDLPPAASTHDIHARADCAVEGSSHVHSDARLSQVYS